MFYLKKNLALLHHDFILISPAEGIPFLFRYYPIFNPSWQNLIAAERETRDDSVWSIIIIAWACFEQGWRFGARLSFALVVHVRRRPPRKPPPPSIRSLDFKVADDMTEHAPCQNS